MVAVKRHPLHQAARNGAARIYKWPLLIIAVIPLFQFSRKQKVR